MKLYEIKIGELYLNDLRVDVAYAETNFIRDFELSVDLSDKFTAGQVKAVVKLLEEIGINKEVITIMEYK